MLGRPHRVSCLVGGVLVLSVVWCGVSSLEPEAHQERGFFTRDNGVRSFRRFFYMP